MPVFQEMERRDYVALAPMNIYPVGFGFFPEPTKVEEGTLIHGNTNVGRLGDCQVTVVINGKEHRGELSAIDSEEHPLRPSGPYGRVLFNTDFLQIKE